MSACNNKSVLSSLLRQNGEWASKFAEESPELLKNLAKGQAPKVLWFGCADSRVPETVVCGCRPGDMFVHRNIANTFNHDDESANAILLFGVKYVKIRNIVVVGHYGCAGVANALGMAKQGDKFTPAAQGEDDHVLHKWLAPLHALARTQIDSYEAGKVIDDAEEQKELVRSHVRSQVANIESTELIRNLRKAGEEIAVEGWVYDVATGMITDLDVHTK